MKTGQSSIIPLREKEAFFSWFASLYLHAPTARLLEPFKNPQTLSVLTHVFQDEPYHAAIKELTAYIDKASVEDLRDEFNSLFVVPSKRSYVPAYESSFRERQGDEMGNLWGKTTGDVAKLYREAGYEASKLQGVCAPDHVGIELAFIAKLCADTMQCLKNNDQEKADSIGLLRKTFLEQHLSKWIEDFSNALNASPASIFYKHLSGLTTQLVFLDVKDV